MVVINYSSYAHVIEKGMNKRNMTGMAKMLFAFMCKHTDIVHKPEIFVIDSPVLSLKEDVDDTELATEGMKASLFNYILQHPCANQIIIIENELPEADYSSAYLREFTKENGFWKTSPVTYRKK